MSLSKYPHKFFKGMHLRCTVTVIYDPVNLAKQSLRRRRFHTFSCILTSSGFQALSWQVIIISGEFIWLLSLNLLCGPSAPSVNVTGSFSGQIWSSSCNSGRVSCSGQSSMSYIISLALMFAMRSLRYFRASDDYHLALLKKPRRSLIYLDFMLGTVPVTNLVFWACPYTRKHLIYDSGVLTRVFTCRKILYST